MDRKKWRQEINANCPHHVDLTPPGDGYGEAVRAQIMDFLESRIGSFDMYVELADGEPFIRYCFEADAEAFHALFASVAEKAIYKKAG